MTGPVFESERFVYRPLEITDDDLAREQFLDPDVARYVGGVWPAERITVEAMALWCRRALSGCIGVWVIVDKESGEKLGTTILLPMPIDAEDTEWNLVIGDGIPGMDIETGYVLKRRAWGRGVATEACRRTVHFAFEATPLRHVVACTDPDNAASQRVLLKSGLRRDGWSKAYTMMLPMFRVTREQWLSDRAAR